MEDFVTWVDSSKIKQHVLNYNDEVSSASAFVSSPLKRSDFFFCFG